MKSHNNNNNLLKINTIWNFADCGQPSDYITIKSFSLNPDPPEPGKKLTIYVSTTVNDLIQDGAYADVTVKLGSYIKLIQKRFDICEELSNANATLQCPIQPGDYDLVHEVELPHEIPRAKYNVEARAYTNLDDDLACANIMIDFMKS
ncbi:hypothetical protein O181_065752 [Austropuccinia psidii MF-1]|uniref:Phosphatidylglycerol/phosphatidylinositol transfer protein n=1 Tax=Austropuccinia psidii MF-1 TaxID=1389203 RepID=A0A9Q3EXZ1_9BASI|nr:hypothetical protein [Austropuccinia psidii MF-1]